MSAELVTAVNELRDEVRRLGEVMARPERMAYTPGEVAVVIGVPPQTVLRFIRNGELEATKRDGYRGYLISVDALRQFLAKPEPQLRSA